MEKVRSEYALSDYQMRQLVGAAYSSQKDSFLSGAHTPDSINQLTQELRAIEKKYGNGVFGFNEIGEYRNALHKKEKEVLNAAAQAQRDDRAAVINEGASHAAEVLLRSDIGMSAKMDMLAQIQDGLGLNKQQMREFLGRVLKDHQSEILDQVVDKQSALRLKQTMKLMDERFGRGGVALWENSAIQSAVDKKLRAFERGERDSAELERDAEHGSHVKRAAHVLLNPHASGYSKVEALMALKEDLGLSGGQLRALIGEALNSYGSDALKGMTPDVAKQLRADMKIIDRNLGVLGVMVENDAFERGLGKVK